MILGMSYRQSQHARTAIDPTMRIPEIAGLSPRALAPGDLPSFALASFGINELVAFLPAHLKAQAVAPEPPEPGTVAIAPIKNVAHQPPPAAGHLAQQAVLLHALLTGHAFVPLPPAHGHHLGDAIGPHQQQAFPLIAAHTRPPGDWADCRALCGYAPGVALCWNAPCPDLPVARFPAFPPRYYPRCTEVFHPAARSADGAARLLATRPRRSPRPPSLGGAKRTAAFGCRPRRGRLRRWHSPVRWWSAHSDFARWRPPWP